VIDTALAQGAVGGATPAVVSFLPLVLVFGVFYFLLIRPQQQKAKEHQEMLDSLKRNDEVITGGGLLGRVIAINDDVVTVEIAPKVQVRVSRATLSDVVSSNRDKGKSKAAEKTKEKDKDK